MSLKEKSHFLNLGNCGGKIGKIFVGEMNYSGTFGNGSTQDLKLLGNTPNTYHLRNFDGFGGYRDKALECSVTSMLFQMVVIETSWLLSEIWRIYKNNIKAKGEQKL